MASPQAPAAAPAAQPVAADTVTIPKAMLDMMLASGLGKFAQQAAPATPLNDNRPTKKYRSRNQGSKRHEARMDVSSDSASDSDGTFSADSHEHDDHRNRRSHKKGYRSQRRRSSKTERKSGMDLDKSKEEPKEKETPQQQAQQAQSAQQQQLQTPAAAPEQQADTSLVPANVPNPDRRLGEIGHIIFKHTRSAENPNGVLEPEVAAFIDERLLSVGTEAIKREQMLVGAAIDIIATSTPMGKNTQLMDHIRKLMNSGDIERAIDGIKIAQTAAAMSTTPSAQQVQSAGRPQALNGFWNQYAPQGGDYGQQPFQQQQHQQQQNGNHPLTIDSKGGAVFSATGAPPTNANSMRAILARAAAMVEIPPGEAFIPNGIRRPDNAN